MKYFMVMIVTMALISKLCCANAMGNAMPLAMLCFRSKNIYSVLLVSITLKLAYLYKLMLTEKKRLVYIHASIAIVFIMVSL